MNIRKIVAYIYAAALFLAIASILSVPLTVWQLMTAENILLLGFYILVGACRRTLSLLGRY